MARVTSISPDDRTFRAAHPTEVEGRYLVQEVDGRKVLQLNTYGSPDRDMPGKLSQTLQFDENAARQLHALLEREFNFPNDRRGGK